MSLGEPAYSGSESRVGMCFETDWGVTPTTGSDPSKVIDTTKLRFVTMKEESINGNPNVEVVTDEMAGDRMLSRAIENGRDISGNLRFLTGPESVGWLLTAILGAPTTTTLHASDGSYGGVYQHVWPAAARTRADWPKPMSIESQYSANQYSKLVIGALLRRLTLDTPNNRSMEATAEFLAKQLVWLYPNGAPGEVGSGTTDAETGVTRPAVLTASPIFISEDPWHWKHLKAYPTIDSVNIEEMLSSSIDIQMLGMEGLFTGGSGRDIGTWKADNCQFSGRGTFIFEDPDRWSKTMQGVEAALEIEFEGDTIRADQSDKSSLKFEFPYVKIMTADLANRVGTIEQELPWTALKDPVTGKDATITLVNTTSAYG